MKEVLLFTPFLGWFWGLPSYIRSIEDGDWLEPFWVTWVLTMPFVGFWFFALLVVPRW